MLFTLLLSSLATPAVAQSPVVLQPSAVINAEGDLQENISVLIQGDRILAVGEDLEVPAQAFVLPLDGVLAPGFVDGFSHLGAFALEEGARTSTPQFRAAESLNLDSDWWQARMEQGVTSVQLVPNPLGSDEPIHPLSGWSCVVATWGDTLGDRFVDDASRQTLGALGGPWRSRQGGPGALAGVADALSAEVPLVKGAQQTGFVAYVDSAEGIQAARDAVANGELHFLCRGDVARYAGLLGDSIAGLEALTENDFQLRRLETIKRMHERGVTVAFGSDAGDSWSTPIGHGLFQGDGRFRSGHAQHHLRCR